MGGGAEKRDAEAHAGDDRKKKEEIEARNRADSMVYNIEKMLKEHRDKVSAEDAKAVETAMEETKRAMQEGGVDRINQATSKLETASHKLAEAMYKASSQGGGQAGPQGGSTAGGAQSGPSGDGAAGAGKPKDDVVDAEFVDVEDKK